MKTKTLSTEITRDDALAFGCRISIIAGWVTWSKFDKEKGHGKFYLRDDKEAKTFEEAKDGKAAAFVMFSHTEDGFPKLGERVICVNKVDCNTKEYPHKTMLYPIAVFAYEDDSDLAAVYRNIANGILPKEEKKGE